MATIYFVPPHPENPNWTVIVPATVLGDPSGTPHFDITLCSLWMKLHGLRFDDFVGEAGDPWDELQMVYTGQIPSANWLYSKMRQDGFFVDGFEIHDDILTELF